MALENILSEEIVQKLGWTLLHFIWQAAAVALLLTILLAVLRKSSANLRYIVACAALGLIVLLPITTMQLVPVSVSQPTANIEPAPAPVILPAQEIREIATVEMSIPEEPVQYENASTAFNASWKQRAADRLEPALPYIVSAWLLGVFGLSLWHLGGWAQLQRLRKQMVKQVDDSLNTKLRRLSERLRVKRAVQLMESALVQVPTVVGWLRPVILLPASALTGLSSEQLEALLAHELAHIRRYDYLVNMLQTVVETLGFYHPAVWWVSHEIRIERENCCDDLAVSISGDRVCYARALTSMEEIRGRRGELAVAAAGGNLFGRIRRLVGKDSADTSRASWIPSVITILLIAIIAIPTTLALTANDKTPQSAQFLLDKMLEHRSRVKNLQYIAEAAGRDETDEHIKWMEDRIKKMREEGASERDIGFSERTLEQWKRWRKEHENRYEIRKCTIDNEGRSKIELTRGDYDASGKKMPDDYKLIRAWNGIQSVEFYQKRGSLPATLEATIKDVPSASIHPWRLFISDLCQYLEETIEAKRDVSVEKLKDGTYRIAFDYKVNDKTTRRIMAVIDPSKGYTCALREDHNDQGKCTSRYTSTYEEVAENIWFPVSGQLQTSSSDSTNYKRSFKSSQIKINGPAFNASYFDVDIPEGTTVTDEVQDKQYIVGSKRVHDLDEPQKPSAKMEQVDPNSWQEKFYSIYRLEDGQVLKRIAPPFIPERRGYFKSVQPGKYSANTPYHLAKQFIFRWDGDLNFSNMHMGEGIPRLSTTLGSAFGLSSNEYDIAPELLNMDMSGDWILRKDTPQEQLLQALEQIIKKETGRGIRFVKQKVETEVIVARGKYHLTPLPNAKKKDCVQVYTDKMDTDSGAGGGSGKLSKFLRFVGNHRIKKIIIDRTESGDVELSWRNHYSSDISWLEQYKQQYKERADMLLNNLSRQMGLTFEREKITVEKWFVAEQESSAESVASSPMIAKSPVSSVADKRHIQIDCLVLEIYAPVRMDRESIIAAQNVLGEIITTRTRGETVVTRTNRTSGNSASIAEKPTVEELIREAAGTTYSVDDSSIVTRDRQATQGQLKPMVDLLVSRGFVKILMNPTLEVVDGGTAKISSKQKIPSMQDPLEDSIQITPNVLEDGNIILQVEATLHQRSISQSDEQTPIINKLEISTQLRLSPDESGIIGGIGPKQAGLITKPGMDAKNPEVPATEILVILTPTIVAPVAEPQKQMQPDIDIDKILIDTRIIKASNYFLKYIGLDPNLAASSEGWSEYLVHNSDDSTSFVVDKLYIDLLLRNVAVRMRTHNDIQILSKPQILAMAGKKCEIHITDSESYMLRAPTEPNDSSEGSESKSNRIELGTTIRMTPTLTPDSQNIELDFEWEYRQLRVIKEHTGPDGNVQKVPQVDIDSIKTLCTIPNGKTLLIITQKITDEVESKTPVLGDLPLISGLFHNNSKTTEENTLLIMVTPRTYIKKTLQTPQTPRFLVDPNDPLIKKLEEKFKRSDEKR